MRSSRRAVLALPPLLFALAVLRAPRTLALDASPGVPPQVQAGYEKVADEVLCFCGCARQTVHECTCSIAYDLRADWERKLASGSTPEQLIADYIAEHGEQARNVPPKKGINLVAWFGPGIAILVAGAATLALLSVWAARGRRARAATAAAARTGSPGEPGGVGADEPVRERLERELREFDT